MMGRRLHALWLDATAAVAPSCDTSGLSVAQELMAWVHVSSTRGIWYEFKGREAEAEVDTVTGRAAKGNQPVSTSR